MEQVGRALVFVALRHIDLQIEEGLTDRRAPWPWTGTTLWCVRPSTDTEPPYLRTFREIGPFCRAVGFELTTLGWSLRPSAYNDHCLSGDNVQKNLKRLLSYLVNTTLTKVLHLSLLSIILSSAMNAYGESDNEHDERLCILIDLSIHWSRQLYMHNKNYVTVIQFCLGSWQGKTAQ